MAVPASTQDLELRMQVDIACWVQGRLLIYGWILNFASDIAVARLHVLDQALDLKAVSLHIPRPDVTLHFRREATGGSDHGFYALLDLPEGPPDATELRFEVASRAGAAIERFLLVERQAEPPSVALKPFLDTLHPLLRHLPAAEAQRLIEFAAPALATARAPPDALDPPMRFTVDLCCVLQERILIVAGWLLDPLAQLSAIKLRFESSVFDLRGGMVRVARADLASVLEPYRGVAAVAAPGFVFAALVSTPTTHEGTASFTLTGGNQPITLTHNCLNLPHESLGSFLTWLAQSDPDSALSLNAQVAALLTPSDRNSERDRTLRALLALQSNQAVARLPTMLQNAAPQYMFLVDHAVAVADQGVFLIGWFAAASLVSAQMKLLCHAGDATFDIAAHWSRCARPDVLTHLAKLGISSQEYDHGYLCYVPLASSRGPYYISLQAADGVPARMRVAAAPASESALPTIRAILTTFNSRHPQLLQLLEKQICPAVGAAWAARPRPAFNPVVEHFGAAPANIETSVIVPLFGRHDFAEYQLALFADDADFQRLELIYVVDDPAIYEDFRSQCDGLYGMYRVPFTVVFPGENLGFAGANNCAARIARGSHLLLMNSDVFPKSPGWVSAMMQTYRQRPDAGILGVKLLLENGGVQHAGMEFRRFAGWAGLWTNYHPYKGQSAVGLGGVREVHAVTAACVLIETALYRKLGGLSEDYVIGDFEDSDLCLRVLAAGRRNYLDLDIELYHLERQSQNRVGDDVFRSNLTLYNCWLHDQRWSSTIERLQGPGPKP